jgi:8-oxo-dGTP diphosphatase
LLKIGQENATILRVRKLVVAALCERDDRVLLSQRAPHQPMPNLWELPGGKIEPGESPTVALRREIAEELGCDCEVGAIFDVVFFAYADFDLYLLVYRCTLAAEPRAIEVAQVAWVPRAELSRYEVLPADVELVRRLATTRA